MGHKRWSKEEEDLLMRWYGSHPIERIAKKLGKTVCAVINKRQRLKLGAFLGNGDYITLSQLTQAVKGRDTTDGYAMISWVKNRGLPVEYQRVGECSFKVVNLEKFWEWAEENKSFLDFSKMEENILGAEPAWVKEQRRADARARAIKKVTPWTKMEDARLISFIKEGQKTGQEIALLMNRSYGAVIRRCGDLAIDNPKRIGPHDHSWTGEEQIKAVRSVLDAIPYPVIAQDMGMSEKAIRGLMYRLYKTENQDKIRAIVKKEAEAK